MEMFLHIKKVKYLDDYKIEVIFNNGKKGIADLSDTLKGTAFTPLKDKSVFAKVAVDKELETIVWPNGVDLAPEYVYFKAFQEDPHLINQFKDWGYLP